MTTRDPIARPEPRRAFGSVRARLFALLLVAAIPALGAAAVATLDRLEAVRREADAQAGLAADAVAARYRQRLEGVRAILTTLGTAPAVRSGGTACDAVMIELRRAYPDWFSNLYAVDGDGRLTCSIEPMPTGASFVDSPLFVSARTRDGFALGPFEDGGGAGRRVFTVGRWIKIENGFVGMVAAGVRLDSFLRVADDVPLPRGAAVVVRDAGGNRATALGEVASDAAWPTGPDRRGLTLVLGPDGGWQRLATVQIEDELGVGVAVPNPAQLRTREILAGLGSALLLLALCFAVVSWGTNTLVIRPIRALTGAVRGWSGTEREFRPPPQIAQAPSELRALAQAFDTAAREIAERGERLATLAEQRGMLVREMHHRVKNNLQIVASMLSLQERRAVGESARGALRAARDRISALTVLHKHLYADEDPRLVNLHDYLAELAITIHDLLDDEHRERIRLEIDLPAIGIDIDRAVPLALVVAEALTNAFKHAFADERTGTVALRCQATDGELDLTIADDGVGRPEPTDDGGLGAHLMQGFARQLGGKLTVESGAGTVVRLRFARSAAPRQSPQPATGAGV